MAVPVFDEEYRQRMAQREQMKRATAFMQGMHDAKQQFRRGVSPPDPITEAREAYATGRIDLGEFSARVDVALRGRR